MKLLKILITGNSETASAWKHLLSHPGAREQELLGLLLTAAAMGDEQGFQAVDADLLKAARSYPGRLLRDAQTGIAKVHEVADWIERIGAGADMIPAELRTRLPQMAWALDGLPKILRWWAEGFRAIREDKSWNSEIRGRSLEKVLEERALADLDARVWELTKKHSDKRLGLLMDTARLALGMQPKNPTRPENLTRPDAEAHRLGTQRRRREARPAVHQTSTRPAK